MSKKKLVSLGVIGVASVLTLAACNGEKEDVKKTETKKDIQVSTERTNNKELLYTEVALSLYNTLLYSPAKNLETNTGFASIGYGEADEKPYGYLLLDSTIELMSHVDDKELTDSEKELKKLLISIKEQEKKVLEVTFGKFDKEKGIVVLNEEEQKTYDKEREVLLKLYKDNLELIEKTVTAYFAIEFKSSDDYTKHIEHLKALYENEKEPYELNKVLSAIYTSIQDKKGPEALESFVKLKEVIAKEKETEMYKTNSVYKAYIDQHEKLYEVEPLLQEEKYDEAFIRYATVGSLVSVQYGQRSVENDQNNSYLSTEIIKLLKEGTFDSMFEQKVTADGTATEGTTTEGTTNTEGQTSTKTESTNKDETDTNKVEIDSSTGSDSASIKVDATDSE